MRGWRCAACDGQLLGGDHGPYLSDVVEHLRAVHGDQPFDEAFAGFHSRFGGPRRPVAADVTVTGHAHPATSHAAARRARPRSGSDRLRVLAFVEAAGGHGATDDELEVALDLPHQTASARRNGLVADGWLVASGRTRQTRTGADATVWVTAEP